MVARAKAGFEAVEFLFPYEWPATDVAKWREAAGSPRSNPPTVMNNCG